MEDKTFDLLTRMYSEFKNEFKKVEARFENMEQRMESIKGHIIRLENKQGIDSKALLDGYKLTYENTVVIKDDIKDMKEVLDEHEIKLRKIK
jgi:tetrahydromethanopterin S-methyltransferase subunit G